MAHIANCIAEFDAGSTISKPSSPVPPMDMASPPAGLTERPYVWRMQQPEQQQPRYQLFPKERQLPVLINNKVLDLGKSTTVATEPSVDKTEKSEKPSAISGLRIRINQHNIARRRKVSVPDAGPMTTVQEVPMDSPTIPGRPALHERSISAPGNSWMHHTPLDDPYYSPDGDDDDFVAAIDEAFMANSSPASEAKGPLSPRQRGLHPLVIPEQPSQAARPPLKRPFNHMRSESTPVESSRLARLGGSLRTGAALTPSTLMSDLRTPRSAGTAIPSATTIPTPVSAPADHRPSPMPWERRCITPMTMERAASPQVADIPRAASATGHHRGASEASSIMDRGRPRKRSDGRGNHVKSNGGTPKGSDPRYVKSPERRAFEELPEGWKLGDAIHNLSIGEAATLQKQAYSQAERFEILKAEDVEALSKELRSLDERTEYLRRTYTSLRTGRRNLHSRICQYLRSPRVARFSYDAMLKQEEALAELDASIDDWVNKLEKAENRRTRVRQKLLEHVAAAAILPLTSRASVASETLQQAMGLQLSDVTTPPRSPSKHSFTTNHREAGSPSPQRVVAQVPSTILEQPIVEEAAEGTREDQPPVMAELKRADVESIKVYAGDDVYTLLADVEKELSKMSFSDANTIPNDAPEAKRTQLHRQRSHELLSGLGGSPVAPLSQKKELKNVGSPAPYSPPGPTPPIKDDSVDHNLLLTKAVFKPGA